jgi:hypothetical protein
LDKLILQHMRDMVKDHDGWPSIMLIAHSAAASVGTLLRPAEPCLEGLSGREFEREQIKRVVTAVLNYLIEYQGGPC